MSRETRLLILCLQCLLVWWWWLCLFIEGLAQVLQVFLVPNLATRIVCMTKKGGVSLNRTTLDWLEVLLQKSMAIYLVNRAPW